MAGTLHGPMPADVRSRLVRVLGPMYRRQLDEKADNETSSGAAPVRPPADAGDHTTGTAA